ncbi:MAG TPA: ATP-binding cassette domain-containing protein [Rhodothermales bacterium]|nr:ATP-binding cassette domain-containing protein [Rhodothermales bacterium]
MLSSIMQDTQSSIAVTDLTKAYRNGVKALVGISFTVHQGEIFGLLGPNGAGKSTTVRILATLTRPDGGQAEIAGYDVLRQPGDVRLRIGYVAQNSGVDKHATGRENLTLQAQLLRVPPREIPERVSRLLEWIDLSDAADRLVRTYSGGMKRRLDIAMGLVHDPAVLFLDEPTTGLDPETRAAMWNDLARLRRDRKLTILLTTHYLEEADELCDRLAIVDHGRIVIEGTPNELKAQIRGDTVTLDVGGQTDRTADLLHSAGSVMEVIPDGSAVIARVANGATALPMLVSTLERGGVPVRAATLSRPSLDDVYLHYTGHRFAAGSPDPAIDAKP